MAAAAGSPGPGPSRGSGGSSSSAGGHKISFMQYVWGSGFPGGGGWAYGEGPGAMGTGGAWGRDGSSRKLGWGSASDGIGDASSGGRWMTSGSEGGGAAGCRGAWGSSADVGDTASRSNAGSGSGTISGAISRPAAGGSGGRGGGSGGGRGTAGGDVQVTRPHAGRETLPHLLCQASEPNKIGRCTLLPCWCAVNETWRTCAQQPRGTNARLNATTTRVHPGLPCTCPLVPCTLPQALNRQLNSCIKFAPTLADLQRSWSSSTATASTSSTRRQRSCGWRGWPARERRQAGCGRSLAACGSGCDHSSMSAARGSSPTLCGHVPRQRTPRQACWTLAWHA